MKDYYELESVLLAVQSRHLDFFVEERSLIIDYVMIATNDDAAYELITLRDLPGGILNDLNAALSVS